MPDQDTEFTLGTGRILGMFFGLVVLCGAFFVVGFSLGKGSTPMNTTLMDTNVPAVVTAGAAAKPSATQGSVVKAPDCASTPEGCAPAEPNAAVQTSTTPAQSAAIPVAVEQRPTTVAPEVTRPATLNGNGYIVQVAAVSRQEDAEALVSALRKKQYGVFITNPTTDSLYHVQIGPFADPKDAESVRARLVADGYNPILKR